MEKKLIKQSVEIKIKKSLLKIQKRLVLRKNPELLGHTIGHAFENLLLFGWRKSNLLHGEAIAVGMICEAWLFSSKKLGLPSTELHQISRTFLAILWKKLKSRKKENYPSF